MTNKYHLEILNLIQRHAGNATQHTFLDSYLGNHHPRYPISIPVLRQLAKNWMAAHRELKPVDFSKLLTSLVQGESSTEKCMTGILLDYASSEQRGFDPKLFNRWLNHIEGWAEVDSLCTGKYTVTAIPAQWKNLENTFGSIFKE